MHKKPIKSESLVEWIAQECIIHEDLGIKGKSGILKNMDTRTAFLLNSDYRIRFVYTPKHDSWLNQVEIWFSILLKRLFKRLSIQSKEELKQKIIAFVEFFNKTMSEPFKWTWKGRVLNV